MKVTFIVNFDKKTNKIAIKRTLQYNILKIVQNDPPPIAENDPFDDRQESYTLSDQQNDPPLAIAKNDPFDDSIKLCPFGDQQNDPPPTITENDPPS